MVPSCSRRDLGVCMSSLPRDQLLSDLNERIRRLEGRTPAADHSPIDLGIAPAGDWLPEQGLAVGSLLELLQPADGAGALTLALFLARRACGEGKVLVVVDRHSRFYPPAAARLGIELDRLIVVHPRTPQDALLAVDQSLRAGAVGSVVCWPERLTTPAFRRLQLAAEAGGSLGLLLRPLTARRAPSFAAMRILVAPVASNEAARRVRLEVLRCRGGKTGQSTILEIDDATGDVRVPSGLAAATPAARSGGASG
jgi:protein ImuA